jgi:hypothetical protein
LPDQAAVALKGKRHFRERERRQGQVMLDVGGFGFLGAQEFPAGRQVEE